MWVYGGLCARKKERHVYVCVFESVQERKCDVHVWEPGKAWTFAWVGNGGAPACVCVGLSAGARPLVSKCMRF